MISPVPFKKEAPPRRNPDMRIPNASSKDVGFSLAAADDELIDGFLAFA